MALAGLPKPEGMQGRVFLGDQTEAPRQYVFGARDRCDETVFRLRTVRDARYRYIRNFTPERPFLQPNQYKENSYPVWNLLKELAAEGKLTPAQKALTAPTMPPEELYDLAADPYEIQNLATSSNSVAHAALGRQQVVLAAAGSRRPTTKGRVMENPAVAAARRCDPAWHQSQCGKRAENHQTPVDWRALEDSFKSTEPPAEPRKKESDDLASDLLEV